MLAPDGESPRGNGERALKLAGRALDPNAPGGPARALGQRWLREAFVAGARVLCRDATVDSVETAARALAGAPVPGRTRRRRAEAASTLGQSSLPDRAALTVAELEVTRVLDEANGTRRIEHAGKRAFWTIAALVASAAAALILADRALYPPWENYRWSASSAWGEYATSGRLADHDGSFDLVFHTKEEVDPWVVVDLRSTRTVSEVTVVNRADCCRDRGLPLVMELAGEDERFVEVGVRTVPFDTWHPTFPPRKVRYVRLRAKGKTVLHLRDIQIR